MTSDQLRPPPESAARATVPRLPVQLSSLPKELLLYLVAHPQGRTREQIGLAFWPDASSAQVRNGFHVTLHHVRKALGDSEWIVLDNERYRIDPALGSEFDAALFEEQARAVLRELRESGGSADRLRSPRSGPGAELLTTPATI